MRVPFEEVDDNKAQMKALQGWNAQQAEALRLKPMPTWIAAKDLCYYKDHYDYSYGTVTGGCDTTTSTNGAGAIAGSAVNRNVDTLKKLMQF